MELSQLAPAVRGLGLDPIPRVYLTRTDGTELKSHFGGQILSFSHTRWAGKNWAAAIVGEGSALRSPWAWGIDLELALRETHARLKSKLLDADERVVGSELSALQVWCLKEAVFKATQNASFSVLGSRPAGQVLTDWRLASKQAASVFEFRPWPGQSRPEVRSAHACLLPTEWNLELAVSWARAFPLNP